MRRPCVAIALVLLAALAVAPGALAGPPGHWSRVTGIEGVEALNTDDIGLQRTADGVLHVAWTRSAGGISDVLLHSTIAANAKSVSPPFPILSAANNGINSSVELIAGPSGGLRVLFAGLFPKTPIDLVMSSATAPAAGAPWSPASPVSNNAVATASKVYVASGIGAAVSPAGLTTLVWGDSGPSEGGYHLGLDPLSPDISFPSTLERDPGAAFDAITGAGYLAWNELGGSGSPNALKVAAPGGAPITAPNSAAAWVGQRVSISGRIGAPGVYVAYGSGNNQFDATPALWRVGASKLIRLKRQRDAEHTGLAPAPGGRLWLYWEREGRLYALRTDKQAKRLGAIVSAKLPKGASVVYRLQGEGSRGPLDLFALTDAKGGLGYLQQRILPGLTLLAKPKPAKAGKKVTLNVSDAGEAVKGAKVVLKLGKKSFMKKTDKKGRVAFSVPASTQSGRYPVTARKGGYAKARAKIRIKG